MSRSTVELTCPRTQVKVYQGCQIAHFSNTDSSRLSPLNMHWLLLIGGQAYWGGGQVVNRASLHHCSSLQLEDTINRSFNNIYGVINGYAPPMPHLHTYALGLQVQHQCSIEKEVLPEMHRRMKRLDVSYYHENFYEDSAEGFGNVNLLSREQCMAWLQHIADHLMDCEDFDENEVVLYEFPNRPEGFSKEALPEVSVYIRLEEMDGIFWKVKSAVVTSISLMTASISKYLGTKTLEARNYEYCY